MARVFFEFDYDFEAAPQAVWDELVDWKGHETWIVSTYVDIHDSGDASGVGAEFTSWTGPFPTSRIGQRLSLEDRMRVSQLDFDATTASGTCRVEKLGPVLGGWAGFTVAPADARGMSTGHQTHLSWTEDVTVRFAPQLLAPLLSRVGIIGFRFSMGRLARQLKMPAASV